MRRKFIMLNKEQYLNEVCKKMRKIGYKQSNIRLNMIHAQIIGFLVTLPIWFFLFIIYLIDNDYPFYNSFSIFSFLIILLIAIIVIFILNTLIYILSLIIVSQNVFQFLIFYFDKNSLAFTTSFLKPLKKSQYIFTISSPFIFSLILYLLSLIFHSFLLLCLSFFMIMGNCHIMYLLTKILKQTSQKKNIFLCDSLNTNNILLFEKQ